MKKFGLIIVTVIAAASVLFAGVASAQDATPPAAPSGQQQPGMPPTTAGGALLPQLLQIVATDLNLQPQDILQQMRGQTLADIIKANNGDVDKITADITKAVTDRLNQAVTDGQVTQERADAILGNLATTIQNALDGQFRPMQGGFGGRGFGGRGNGQGFGGGRPGQGNSPGGLRPGMMGAGMDVRPLLQAVTDATKLTDQQIAEEIRSGKTLGDIITEHGGDPEAVVTAAVATATTKLDTIRQNGTLTQDQETAIVNGLKAFYEATLNGAFHQAQPTTTSAGGSV